jgi:GntR family transcriptional regulator/MocR family aminotransferase
VGSSGDSFFLLGIGLPKATIGLRRKTIYEHLKSAIIDGRVAPGIQLPASRALAHHLGVSRNSIVATYDLLHGEGYIVVRQGAGSFTAKATSWAPSAPDGPDPNAVTRISPRWRAQAPIAMTPPPQPVNFRVGAPDADLFPYDIWRRLMKRAIRRLPDHIGWNNSAYGVDGLRQAIAGHVSRTRAVACNANNILVTHGAQQAFDLLARILIIPGQTVVAVENPGYPPARAVFAAAGAVVQRVRLDSEGIVVADIPPTAKVIYVTPSHQFPLGVPMSQRRRLQLLEFAERANAVIIEDDYDGEYRFQDRPLDALQTLDRSKRVFYVGTFSKCMLRDIRLGFVVCPSWALDALARAKQLSDGYCSVASQHALTDFIEEGHLVRHVRRTRNVYARRRSVLLQSLKEHCSGWLRPFPAMAGLHIAAAVSNRGGARSLVAAAANNGIGLRDIAEFAVGKTSSGGVVIGYGCTDETVIPSAVTALGKLY